MSELTKIEKTILTITLLLKKNMSKVLSIIALLIVVCLFLGEYYK